MHHRRLARTPCQRATARALPPLTVRLDYQSTRVALGLFCATGCMLGIGTDAALSRFLAAMCCHLHRAGINRRKAAQPVA